MKLRAVEGWVIVEPIKEGTRNGVVMPYAYREMALAKVLSVGMQRDKYGKQFKPLINAGDKVIYEPYVGQEFEFEGRELLALPYEDVYGVVYRD